MPTYAYTERFIPASRSNLCRHIYVVNWMNRLFAEHKLYNIVKLITRGKKWLYIEQQLETHIPKVFKSTSIEYTEIWDRGNSYALSKTAKASSKFLWRNISLTQTFFWQNVVFFPQQTPHKCFSLLSQKPLKFWRLHKLTIRYRVWFLLKHRGYARPLVEALRIFCSSCHGVEC